jgi:hypothetical protein
VIKTSKAASMVNLVGVESIESGFYDHSMTIPSLSFPLFGLTVCRLMILPISWIIYGGCAIRDDSNLGRVAAPSRINAFVNGGHEHAEVQGDGGQLQ